MENEETAETFSLFSAIMCISTVSLGTYVILLYVET